MQGIQINFIWHVNYDFWKQLSFPRDLWLRSPLLDSAQVLPKERFLSLASDVCFAEQSEEYWSVSYEFSIPKLNV